MLRACTLGLALFIAGLLCLNPLSRAQLGMTGIGTGGFGAATSEGTVLIDLATNSTPGSNGVTSQTFINGSVAGGGFTLDLGSGPNGTTNRALAAMLMFCGAASGATSTSPTLTWDSVSMSLIGSVTSSLTAGAIFLFGLPNPNTGTKNLAAAWTGGNQATLALLSVVGADQTGGATTFANLNSATGLTSISTVSVTAASTRISFAAFSNPALNYTTPGSGNTDIGHVDTCTVTALASDYDTGHTNPTLSYSPSVASWVALGVSIKGN